MCSKRRALTVRLCVDMLEVLVLFVLDLMLVDRRQPTWTVSVPISMRAFSLDIIAKWPQDVCAKSIQGVCIHKSAARHTI